MMEVLGYITENALILIPALLIIGQIIKNIEAIPDKWIPVILLPIGIAGALLCGGPSVDSAIQGILVTGVAVYGNAPLLRKLAGTLLDNACKYAGEKGVVTLTLEREGDKARLMVNNTGAPIPPEAVPAQ